MALVKVFIPVQGRREVLKIFADNIQFPVIAVCSTTSDYRFCKKQGWEVTKYPNNNLGDKLQHGLRFARDLEWDSLIMMGSDDIMCDNLAKTYEQLSSQKPFIGLKQCYIYDLDYKMLRLWTGYRGPRKGEPAGAGRLYRRDLLERLDFDIWTGGKVGNVDSTSWSRIKDSVKDIQLIDIRRNFMFVDLKDDDSTTKAGVFMNYPSVHFNYLYDKIPNSEQW